MRCPQREFFRRTFASSRCLVFGFPFVSIVLIEPFFVGPCWPEPAEAAVFVRLQTLPSCIRLFCVDTFLRSLSIGIRARKRVPCGARTATGARLPFLARAVFVAFAA